MKTMAKLMAVAACAAAPAFGQLSVPGDGSDGILNITSNTVFDLSQAVTGVWSNNNTANAGKGIYDSNLWAVVFKYQSVNIAINSTNRFKNHPSRAPVVWLVRSNATISGVINLIGQALNNSSTNAEPGPGGFRGAISTSGNIVPMGVGGRINTNALYSSLYGGPRILPLIGGSGLGDTAPGPTIYGVGGAGAILIAVSSNLTLNGSIIADGWPGFTSYSSGGGIRLIANALLGSGSLSAVPEGRIRIEANSMAPTINASPVTPRVAPDNPPLIWPEPGSPECRIVSVGGMGITADPRADVMTSPDAVVASTSSVEVVLQTLNFPTNGTVQVRLAPKLGVNYSWINATCLSGTVVSATWRANMIFTNGYSVLQARAYSP